MVVHREREEDGEEEERQPRLDRVHLREAEELVAHSSLEDEHEDPVGGAHREQVEHDRLRGDHDRAEGDREQDEAEPEHEDEDEGQPVGHQLAVVDDLCGLAGDVGACARVAERRRDDVRAEALDRLDRRLVAAVAADERLDDRDVAVRADRDLGILEGRIRGQRGPQALDSCLDRHGVRVAVDDDLDRVDRADAELALEGDEAVLRRIAVGDRPDSRRARAQLERRKGERDEDADGDHQADDRCALDARHDRAPEAPLGGGAAAEERQPKRVDAVAEHGQHRR